MIPTPACSHEQMHATGTTNFREKNHSKQILVLLTPDGQRDTTLNGNGVALIDFASSADALFGLTLSPDKTGAVAVGWKGVDSAAVSPTNNDDARVVYFSLPMAQ